MTIRNANDKELQIINDHIPQVFNESITTTLHLTDEAMRAMSQQLKEQGASYYVLIEQGQFKGFMLIGKRKDTFSQQLYGYIYELYVFKSFRRQGVAKQLIDFAKLFFKRQSVIGISLNVFCR